MDNENVIKEKVSNLLSFPLKQPDCEWILYLYEKIYTNKILESYNIYKVKNINLNNIYSDIYNYTNKKYINKQNIIPYSPEMPINNIGLVDLKTEDNILNSCILLINEGINNYNIFSFSNTREYNGYILECICNRTNTYENN